MGSGRGHGRGVGVGMGVNMDMGMGMGTGMGTSTSKGMGMGMGLSMGMGGGGDRCGNRGENALGSPGAMIVIAAHFLLCPAGTTDSVVDGMQATMIRVTNCT